ncbi:MAG: tRNA (adenosine(37)-N6)-threonylcarbamoyltransferase complex dimerization subunit type 1 TsaB [Christensenellales bacterium]
MNILSIETSSSVAGAAILRDGKLAAECYLDHRLTHSEIIMPMVERVLNMAEVSCAEMDAFAVDVGPGSFTGVRIGVSATNGMADALGKPMIPVDSLEAMAFCFPFFAGLAIPVIDARNEQVYAGCYDVASGEPRRVGERFAGKIHDFLRELPKGHRLIFLGDGALAHKELITSSFPGSEFAPAHLNRPRAGAIAALAAMRLERGEVATSALPLYMRSPQAERMRAQREKNG